MALEAVGLCKAFDGRPVISGFSYRFEPSRVYCLQGPSGIGKTTLLSMLMGLLLPDSGKVLGLDGAALSAVFQEDRLCENVSAAANIRLVVPGENQQSIALALREVGLEKEDQLKPARELSGGMKRRVALVRACLYAFDILYLDEPFKGLDAENKQRAIHFLKKFISGKTVILVTHDADETEALCGIPIKLG